jgi:hypothetical protein
MARGGYRSGAGRKGNKNKELPNSDDQNNQSEPDDKSDTTIQIILATDLNSAMPLDFLLAVMRNAENKDSVRMQAAALALPFTAPKPAQIGKKEEKGDAAKKAAAGKFSAPSGPRLVHSNNK